jgi:putative intracellular protease/amidase
MKKLFSTPALLLLGALAAALLFLAASVLSRRPQAQSGAQDAAGRPARMNVAILIFDGVQIIDYAGPYEVFGQAGFNTFTVAEKAEPLTTAMGMIVTPNFSLDGSPKPDIIVIPGGYVDRTVESPKAIKWIRDNEKDARHVLSVCNGAFILARTGLLDGLSTTTFYDLIDELKKSAPKTKVLSDRRYVDNGKFISTAGLSSGIDGALHVVSKVQGPAKAQMVALNMEYNWDPDSKYARAALADRHIRKIFGRGLALESPAVTSYKVVGTKGGTEDWEVVWEVQSATPAPELLKLLNRKLADEAGWRAQEQGTSREPSTSAWSFSGEDGAAWSGRASLRPVAGTSDKFTLTLKVERARRG